jgi:hypothetical protein
MIDVHHPASNLRATKRHAQDVLDRTKGMQAFPSMQVMNVFVGIGTALPQLAPAVMQRISVPNACVVVSHGQVPMAPMLPGQRPLHRVAEHIDESNILQSPYY